MDKIKLLIDRMSKAEAEAKAVVNELYACRHEVVQILDEANTQARLGAEPSEDVYALLIMVRTAYAMGINVLDA